MRCFCLTFVSHFFVVPYKWDQTLAEVSVEVVVPEGKKARDLVIKIEKEKLLVKLKSGEVYIDVCAFL